MKDRHAWQDGVNMLLGMWLFLAPFFGLGPMHGLIAWNSYVFGALIAFFSGLALYRQQLWEEWISLVIGVWLIIAPFALGFAGGALMWNSIVIGLLIGGDALLAMLARHMDTVDASHEGHAHHA